MKKLLFLIAPVAIASLVSCVSGPTYPLGEVDFEPIVKDSVVIINDSTFLYKGDTVTVVNSYN